MAKHGDNLAELGAVLETARKLGDGMTGWVPRGVDASTREVLVDGVPAYMKAALLNFLRPHLARKSTATAHWLFMSDELMRYDLVARRQPSYVERLDNRIWPGFIAELSGDELLDLADWIAHRNNRAVANDLEYLLEAAGSVWTIGKRNGEVGLVRRMSEGVQLSAERSLGEGSAGKILAEAWTAAYGRNPDPEEAYEKAIKAVEHVAAQIVSPKNLKATLGTIVRDMKAQHDWTVDLPGSQDGMVVGMAEALWTGQESRHGGNGYRRPTQSEAETAVSLAVALLQLFASGSVARRSGTP